MRLCHLSISNFRGIKTLEWVIPDQQILCLIGRGDSTKSTILEALRRVFYPHWNLTFVDSDFYLCKTSVAIKVDAILSDLPDAFIDFAKFGYGLCGWNRSKNKPEPEPGGDIDKALHVQLSVESDLEPKWRVIQANEEEEVSFKTADRAFVGVSLISNFSDRDLTWASGSVLNTRESKDNNIKPLLVDIIRSAKTAIETDHKERLADLDTLAKTVQQTGASLGITESDSYQAHLDTDTVSFRHGGIALHDGVVPLRRLGLGSKRMLITGMRTEVLDSHITLLDEVESGLEPYRIARLLRYLEKDTDGKYILTTHSPVVLRELVVSNLQIVHCNHGDVHVEHAAKPPFTDTIQGKIREHAEAFLAPRIIVCEGATEVGLLRGMEEFWMNSGKHPFAYCGVALFDAKGAAKLKESAEVLRCLGYDVAVLADADEPEHFTQEHVNCLQKLGVKVIQWDDQFSLEQQVINDLPWEGITKTVSLVEENLSKEVVLQHIQEYICEKLNPDVTKWEDTPELRLAIGKAAKKSRKTRNKGWFKRQDKSHDWVNAISDYLTDESINQTPLVKKLKMMRCWIDHE